MTKYAIYHPESDAHWIEENPTKEQLDKFYSNDCIVQEIKEEKSN